MRCSGGWTAPPEAKRLFLVVSFAEELVQILVHFTALIYLGSGHLQELGEDLVDVAQNLAHLMVVSVDKDGGDIGGRSRTGSDVVVVDSGAAAQ